MESAPTRREGRRARSREEILDAATAVITEHGVAALNLSDVARRVGLRQPSLYQYFDSRLAVYDALFERGMRQHLDVVRAAVATAPAGLATLRAVAVGTVRFSVENAALSLLLFTPTVPGFEPSEQAYRPSLDVQELIDGSLADAVAHVELHPAAATERGRSLFIAVTAGVASLQTGNDASGTFDEGRYTPLVEPALDMFAEYLAPTKPAGWSL